MTTETNLMGLTQSQNKTTIVRAKKKAGNGQVQQKALKIATMYLTKNSSLYNYIVASKQKQASKSTKKSAQHSKYGADK